MHLLKTLVSCTLLLTSVSLFAGNYTREGNSVVVKVQNPQAQGARLVRLQVLGQKIIRVEATAEQQFPATQSLIIVPQNNITQFTINEAPDRVEVSTSSLKAVVTTSTGRVCFYDENNKLIASENEAGKTFKPFTVPEREIGADGKLTEAQKHGYTWRLLFDSSDDEAFYGLGQHQSEELNMKGKNEDLFQYNTKVSVPFVVSNKNYGVLWDSYSYCRWGNPDDYLQLGQAFTLYDKNGKKGALTGTYTQKDGKQVVRQEDSIYYEYALPDIAARGLTDIGVGNLPKGFKLNGSHVLYEGFLEAPVDNLYRFILYYAGYTKVYIDGKLVVPERWRTAWNPNAYKQRFLSTGILTVM